MFLNKLQIEVILSKRFRFFANTYDKCPKKHMGFILKILTSLFLLACDSGI